MSRLRLIGCATGLVSGLSLPWVLGIAAHWWRRWQQSHVTDAQQSRHDDVSVSVTGDGSSWKQLRQQAIQQAAESNKIADWIYTVNEACGMVHTGGGSVTNACQRMIDMMLHTSIDVDTVIPIQPPISSRALALVSAVDMARVFAGGSSSEVVTALLAAKASVNRLPFEGFSPLRLAAQSGELATMQELLKHPDIDVTAIDPDGVTAFQAAVERCGISAIVDELIAEVVTRGLCPVFDDARLAAGLAGRHVMTAREAHLHRRVETARTVLWPSYCASLRLCLCDATSHLLNADVRSLVAVYCTGES